MELKGVELNLREIVTRELTSKLCQRLGYSFEQDRIVRISAGMDALVKGGVPMPYAFSRALDEELVYHGTKRTRRH